ncbi:hypothetical protein DENIS_3501 [Desulfonema ishimotonii]|uniref:VCBS repeat-containing protein n=1 Tax=Desulfonema ishimotonii TaxID=45657 RepID=A0A401FZX2_9BACT|nr:FG-GAP-like repeat-containing protein [Desulfonema ishimotonii]GBC62529.1 hypothetical protein DENIS_3501 [Desulfonema ishimotonii]
MKPTMRNLWISVCIGVYLLMGWGTAAAKAPEKILVLPFNVYSEKDLSFLKNGIRDMLFSRLSKEGEIVVIDREKTDQAIRGIGDINQQNAAALGQTLGADYVVFGSLTVFGSSISTDAKVLNMDGKQIAMTFNDSGKDNGDVIGHINRFAAQVNGRIFGQDTAVASQSPAPAKQSVNDPRKHPESLWTGRIDAEEGRSDGREAPAAGRLGPAWRSRNFKMEIRNISLGDVDNDGSIEVAFMDQKQILVYRYRDDRFIKVAKVETDVNDRLLSLDVADINGNGRAEIFVTCLNKNTNFLKSFVLEWNGTRLQKIVENAKWYFRVVDVPGRGKVLMGQQRSVRRIFLAGVDEMNWNGTGYISATTVALPGWANVYGFNYGDVTNTGQEMTVAFSERDYLRVIGPDGSTEWESPEEYGGGLTYLESPDEAASSLSDHKETKRRYLPQRILIADVDNDGKNDVLVGKNRDSANRLFAKLRFFKGGLIECLGWDEFGLYPKWKTREISGTLSDYAVGDIDNDGRNELVFSVIKKISSVLGDAKSFIAAQDIKPVN